MAAPAVDAVADRTRTGGLRCPLGVSANIVDASFEHCDAIRWKLIRDTVPAA